jgi:hypothetical protein
MTGNLRRGDFEGASVPSEAANISASRLGQTCGEGEGLGVEVSVAVGVALSAMTGGWVGAVGWIVKGTYGMQMQAAVTTNKATARFKAENLLFDIRIPVFTHLLPNILVLIRVTSYSQSIRQFW